VKKFLSIVAGLALMGSLAFGQTQYSFTFTNGFANGGVVPDNDISGLAVSTNLSGFTFSTISNLTLTLNISGGYNGDLYAFLSGPNGGFAVLLNRSGVSNSASQFGYGDSGFNVTFDDTAANSIQYYQNYSPAYNGNGQLTGTWQPSGLNIDPQSDPSDFLAASQTALFDSFYNTSATGDWTLFLSEGSQSTLQSWGLTITTIPEPSTLALTGLGLAAMWKLRRRK
jgi:subtilisin-like proprotein convertase family protein